MTLEAKICLIVAFIIEWHNSLLKKINKQWLQLINCQITFRKLKKHFT